MLSISKSSIDEKFTSLNNGESISPESRKILIVGIEKGRCLTFRSQLSTSSYLNCKSIAWNQQLWRYYCNDTVKVKLTIFMTKCLPGDIIVLWLNYSYASRVRSKIEKYYKALIVVRLSSYGFNLRTNKKTARFRMWILFSFFNLLKSKLFFRSLSSWT